ncbi:TRAP transporter substrate-binding protein DctP [Limnobaculum parvum]|uniref:ABC transporter substrate-binding protein n=1 Tax=Limnobaculum parvum TaxID=2172103 RepID=A0A2Y9TYW9_9GAMM|nr:TRAP transporter substrate-binding protein DctP [Limnobaculum parvum]AWH88943.1 ABC transporter substrate-binding protein [Limnobaculum parvum]
MQPRHLAKKLLLILLAMLLLPTAALATQTLKYTDHEPLGGMRTRFIKEAFFSAIEKESNGRLKIEAHWGGELASGYDALRVAGEGSTADMAIVVPEYASNDLPLHQIFKSFPIGPSGDKQLEFYRRVYAEIPAFPAELKNKNVVNILFGTGFPVAFFSTNKLNTLEDIKGSKWRTASFWHQDFLRNAGAIPVSMPWGDQIASALKAKTLDGLMVNVDSGYQIGAQNVASNVLVSTDLWLGHLYLLVMNKNTWDKLEKQDKDAIHRAAEIAYQTLGAVMNNSFNTLVDEMKKNGVNVRILEPMELKQWENATKYQEVQATWVTERESTGIKNIGPILKSVSVIMDDFIK